MRKIKLEKGITLVALIITIIVLLILAIVTIRAVQGDGIIQYAKNSKSETIKAQQKEEIMLALNEWKLAKHTVPGATFAEVMGEKIEGAEVTANDDGSVKVEYEGAEIAYNVTEAGVITEEPKEEQPEDEEDDEELAKGEIVTGSVVTLTETTAEGETLTAKIPVGFCIVKDVGEDINNIENGLVISDVPNDDLDNSAHGNQFVWIPVTIENFYAVEGFCNGSRDSMISRCKEAGSSESEDEGKPLADYNVAGTDESIAMYRSVARNGGFYIARFEAGINQTDEDGNQIDNATYGGDEYDFEAGVPVDGSIAPLSKIGFGVWNNIPWGGTEDDTASDGMQGDDSADGAVVVARSMSKLNSYSVTSTLCYGVQWDAVMNFIDAKYINVPRENEEETVEEDSFVRDSSENGNYSGELAVTGSKPVYQVKHIYDLGGNVNEWTMEAFDTDVRICRGSGYWSNGLEDPASDREVNSPEYVFKSAGFRVALYL